MKLNFVLGNPPYQDETLGDNKGFAPPIYDKFMEGAYAIADKVELIHPARFLFNAGSTPKVWNQKMLNDPHFKVLMYEEDASKIFPNTDIKGGVAVSYRDADKDFGAIRTFTRYSTLNGIMKKASPKTDEKSLSDIICTQCRFNLDSLYQDYPALRNILGSEGKDRRFRNNIFEKVSLFTDERESTSDIQVLGVLKNKRVWKFIAQKYVDLAHENLFAWKVLIPRATGSGALGEVFSSPLIAEPGIGYTQTFIGIGSFDTNSEANAALKYVKTKFSRALLGILKSTQDNDREVWRMIPLQDFSASSDINWNTSIANIDRQLYKKYGLSPEEIAFIETHVKEME